MTAPTSKPLRPLKGVRILSLCLNLPGPAALMRCRQMGASCVKLEPPAPAGAAPGTSGDPMGLYNRDAYTELNLGVRLVRADLKTEAGQDLLLDLPQAARLRDGDGLQLDSGPIVRVRARPEPLAEIHAHSDAELVRIAWHLGNRHLPVQLIREKIRIRRDHVIEAMVEQLGGHVDIIDAPFDPEAGAYAGGHSHSHDDDDHHH